MSEISLYSQASKLACHSYMDAGRRPKTPGSEVEDRLLHTGVTIASVSASAHQSLGPWSHRGTWPCPSDTRTRSGSRSRRRTLSLGTLNLFKWAESVSALPSTRRFIIIIQGNKSACPFLWREIPSPPSKATC